MINRRNSFGKKVLVEEVFIDMYRNYGIGIRRVSGTFLPIFLILWLVLVTGCQPLAVVTASEASSHDRLIGVFVTSEYIDLYDFEGYMNDHIDELMTADGEDIMVDSDDRYQGRLYGVVDEDNPQHVFFEGYEGVVFIDSSYEKEGESYSRLSQSGHVTQVGIAMTDEGRTIEGTISLRKDQPVMVYVNAVYENSEGEIYVMGGSGMSSDTNYGGMSQSLSESYTRTENGESITEGFTVKVNFEPASEASLYIIQQMDEHNEILDSIEVTVDTIPESITVGDGTAYILVETIAQEDGVREVTERSIYNDDTYMNLYFFGEGTFAKGYYISIERE